MTHQLIVQFAADTQQDYDRMIALSEEMIRRLPQAAILDGNDFGYDQCNLVIHTSDPEALFERVRDLIAATNPGFACSSGYHVCEDEEYVVLWPPCSTKISVA